MKNIFLTFCLTLLSFATSAAGLPEEGKSTTTIVQHIDGDGTPHTSGGKRITNEPQNNIVPPGNNDPVYIPGEASFEVDQNIFHTPQYMSGFPTSATIWPRVVQVPCQHPDKLTTVCDSYTWKPEYGRGEYLFFEPTPDKPTVVEIKEKPIVILKEVPEKKARE